VGVAGESNAVRIGTQGRQKSASIAGICGVAVSGTSVVVDGNGQLGVSATATPSMAELQAEIAQLRAEIDKLKAQLSK
jgi:hypothetical protein